MALSIAFVLRDESAETALQIAGPKLGPLRSATEHATRSWSISKVFNI